MIGRKLKKNSVALDIVNFGEEDKGKAEKLEALLAAVNNNDSSHIVHVPTELPATTKSSIVVIVTMNPRYYDQITLSPATLCQVVRGGRRENISIYDIVVGDVIPLKIGDQVPADGILISGHSLAIDESSMTGESKIDPYAVEEGQEENQESEVHLLFPFPLQACWFFLLPSLSPHGYVFVLSHTALIRTE
ncbi:hypothetical protein CsSME_00026361 [Camellia sinensis var. sinensis]